MYEYLTTDEDLERRMIRGRVLSVLEFNKIRDKVTSKARTAYGKKICSEMTPCTDFNYVEENLSWTSEAMTHITRFGCLPLGGFRDLTESLSYAEAGGTLSCAQLLSAASFLRSSEEVKSALSKARSAGSPFVDETEPHIVKDIEETALLDITHLTADPNATGFTMNDQIANIMQAEECHERGILKAKQRWTLIRGGFLAVSRGGKKAEPVERVTIAGNFYQLLQQVRSVGSDLLFEGSTIGSPSLDVGEMPVSGK